MPSRILQVNGEWSAILREHFKSMRPIPIVAGQKYTFYTLTGTTDPERNEVIVRSVLQCPECCGNDETSQNSRHRIGTYQLARSETIFDCDIDLRATLVVPGWDLARPCDLRNHASSKLESTAQIATSLAALREMLASNLNPHFDQYKLLLSTADPG